MPKLQSYAMTYDEFQRQLGKAGLSIRKFADVVGMQPNSVTNYASRGEVPSHLAVIAVLLGAMVDNGLDFRLALNAVHVERKKPRGKAKKGRFGGTRQHDLPMK